MLHSRLLALACVSLGASLVSVSALRAQTTTVDNTVTPTLGAFNTTGNNLTLTGTATGTASGVISGSGSLTKSGNGTWTLSASNTVSGPTTISAGTLTLSDSASLSNSAVTIDSGATLLATRLSFSDPGGDYTIGGLGGAGAVSFSTGAHVTFGANNAATTFSGSLGGSGTLTKTGTGTFTFNGTSSGPSIGVSGGTLIFAPSSASTFGAGIFTQTDGTITLSPPDPSKFTGPVFVNGGALAIALPNSTPLATSEINLNFGGTATLGETYKVTALSHTTLNLGSGTTFSTPGQGTVLGGLSGFNITLALTGSYSSPTLTVGANNISSSFGGSLSVTGGSGLQIIKIGTGTWSLSGSLGFLATRVQAGYLELSSGAASEGVILQGGGVRYGQAMTHTGGITLFGGTHGTVDTGSNNVTQSGALGSFNSTDSLTKIGSGTLTLTGAKAFNGILAINAGTVAISQASNLGYDVDGFASRVRFGGGTLRTTASFTSAYQPVTLATGGGTFEVGSGTTLTWNGPITGTGGNTLTKTGAGTLILGGNNLYSGATSLTEGRLVVNGTAANSAFTVSGGILGGSGSVGPLTIASGGTFAPGTSPGLMTVTGDLSLAGLTQMELAGTARGTSYDAVNVVGGSILFGGTLDVVLLGGFNPISGDTFNLFDWTGSASGTFVAVNLPALGSGLSWDQGSLYSSGTLSITASAIPEPSTYAALAGVAMLGFAWRRRRSKAVLNH